MTRFLMLIILARSVFVLTLVMLFAAWTAYVFPPSMFFQAAFPLIGAPR